MSVYWTTKEKIILISDILEYGDQYESWSLISNDLSRTFQTNINLSQSKREGRYSIKNCKQEYKNLVSRYQSQWLEYGSSNSLKLPLAKYIWIQLKSIYKTELTHQLNESRKKLTEYCLRLESVVNTKLNTIDSTPPVSVVETTNPVLTSQENEQQEERIPAMENISQCVKEESNLPSTDSVQPTVRDETNSNLVIFDNSKESVTIINQPVVDELEVKQEANIETLDENVISETNYQISSVTSPSPKQNSPIVEEDISQQNPIDSPSQNILCEHQSSISQTASSILPITSSISISARPESVSSSRSTSRTSSETKTDVVKIIPSTTQKYHVYFSPKNSINNNLGTNKTKKRKNIEESKDENEIESISQQDLATSTTEQSKILSSTAPITRRSISTRSVPNTMAEQEEEKSRKFLAMLSENPTSWQSQSMAIIQFILAHKQGYLFEHEITEEIAPKYHQYVRRPIALDAIRKTLESNEYQTKEYFKRDIYLMLYNAMKYNPRYHHVHRAAKHLFNIILSLFDLPAQEIQGRIAAKSNVSLSNTNSDTPLVKRKRTK